MRPAWSPNSSSLTLHAACFTILLLRQHEQAKAEGTRAGSDHHGFFATTLPFRQMYKGVWCAIATFRAAFAARRSARPTARAKAPVSAFSSVVFMGLPLVPLVVPQEQDEAATVRRQSGRHSQSGSRPPHAAGTLRQTGSSPPHLAQQSRCTVDARQSGCSRQSHWPAQLPVE